MGSDAEQCRPPAGDSCMRLAEIDFRDETFRITTATGEAGLVESIKGLGLLVPPLVKRRGQSHVIVSGFRRLEACRLLGVAAIRARVLPASTPDRHCACCAVAENALQRALNPLETGRATRLLEAFIPDEPVRMQAAAAVGLPSDPEVRARLGRVCDLAPSLQDRLAEGAIGLAMALALDRYAPEFSAACADLFGKLRLGLNRQRELLLLIDEIARRDGTEPLHVLRGSEIAALADDPTIDRSQKALLIRDRLHRRRHPHLARAERAFEHHRRQLQLGKDLALTAPTYFESDTYTLSLRFRDRHRLEMLAERLQRIAAHPSLARILERSWDDEPE